MTEHGDPAFWRGFFITGERHFMRVGVMLALSVIAGGVLLLPGGQGRQPGRALAVLTQNIGTFNSKRADMQRVTELMEQAGHLDILLLQEVPGEALAWKLAGDLKFEYCVFAPYSKAGDGLAVIPRYPLKSLDVIRFNPYAAMAVEADIDGVKLLLLSVHLERIRGVQVSETRIDLSWETAVKLIADEMIQETPRTRAVDVLLSWIIMQPYEHVVLAGDFNSVPFSRPIRAIGSKFNDVLWPGLHYLSGTYNHLPFAVQPRIDYIFHSRKLECLSADVIPRSAGDHYPVRAVLSVKS